MRKFLTVAALALAACGSSTNAPSTVQTPALSLASGTYSTVQSVTITCATSGATIRYTTDGSAPTSSSTAYSSAIAITTTTTLKAYATASGMTDSAVASATYTLQAATPVFSPAPATYATAQSVTLTSATPGAAIHFTQDGSTPTSSSPTYSTPISLPLGTAATTTTLQAIAVASNFQDSAVASGTFVIDPNATPAATPTFSVASGTYSAAQSVAITSTTSGVSIYYTTDGSTPTTQSTLYSGPVSVASSLTLKAIAAGGGHTASAIATATYVINLPKVATPVFSPSGGAVSSGTLVTITCATSGATIHYTTDGSTPTSASPTYSTAISITAAATLKAIATATGFAQSDVATASYTISTGGGTDFLTACNALFNKELSLEESCLQANPDYVNWILTQVGRSCAELQKEITANLVSYNSTQGQSCVAAVQNLTCADLSRQNGLGTPAACQSALTGTVANGGNCYSTNDCAAGYCDSTGAQCPGKCQPYAGLGNSCLTAQCADGQTCSNSVCVANATTVGGPCPCADNLWCDNTNSTCKTPLTQGATCNTTDGSCALGLVCVGTTSGTCKPVVGLGGTCTPGATAFSPTECGAGYICNSATSKCVSDPKIGEPCSAGQTCINSYCDVTATSPTCKALVANGQACNAALFGTDCQSHSCDSTTHLCVASTFGQCALP